MRSGPRSRQLAATLVFLAAALTAQLSHAQANDDSFTVSPGSINNVLDVVANDDVGFGSASILAVTSPNRGGQVRIDSNRRNLIYTPQPGFEGEETFRYTIIYSGFRFSAADVRVLVSGPNTAPVAQDDAYFAERDRDLDVDDSDGVLANDSDADGDRLTAVLVDGPDNGDLDFDSDGSFSYEPDRRFIGEDGFSYRASDGRNLSAPARVRIFVQERNEAPDIASIPDQTANVGVAFELDLADFVSDTDGPEALEFEAVSLPAGLSLSPQGLISGVPTVASSNSTARFRVGDGVDVVDGSFRISVRDDRITDLRLTLLTGPNPVPVGALAAWSITVRNQSNYRIDAPTLGGRFTGEVPFAFGPVSEPGCSLTQDGTDRLLSCQLGALAAGAEVTIELTGSADLAGDLLGSLTVETGGEPDVDPADNSANASLSVAGSVSDVPAQSVEDIAALALASGDIDGDGEDDLIVATAASESVLLFRNVVDPANERKRTLDGVPQRIGSAVRDNDVAVGDLDGDQDLDIVAAGSAAASPRVFLNDGAGTFQAFTLSPLGQEPTAVAIGDINGDGFADLAFAGNAFTRIYFGTGVAGQYGSPASIGGAGEDVVVADLEGDGRAEIVVAGAVSNARIYRFTGASFELRASLETGPTTSVTAEDFNGDGARDLVFGKTAMSGPEWPSNPVYLNRVLSGSGYELAGNLGAAPTFAVLGADADGSGIADAAVLNATGAHQIFLSSSSGSLLVRAADQLAVSGATGAAFGSFSADDRIDLAIGTPDGIRIFRSDGRGRFGIGDVTAPVIEIVGASAVETVVGEPYADPGATATDTADGNLSDRIVVTSNVNTSLIGQYRVTYQVWDDSGNASELATRNVEVRPNQPQGGGGGGAFGWLPLILLAILGCLGPAIRAAIPSRVR